MPKWLGERALEQGFIAISWPDIGDLSKIEASRDAFKAEYADLWPEHKERTIRMAAGVLFRFSNEMQEGDYVLFPSKHNRHVNIGVITSRYIYEPLADWQENSDQDYPNRHTVKWLGRFPRSSFSQSALNEIGTAITLFLVKNHSSEFLSKIGQAEVYEEDNVPTDDDTATRTVTNLAEETAQDFIIKRLHTRLTGYEFEHFIAHVLECMGYKARVTEASGDGGVDVIAHRDKLGFEPPIVKVQCKRTTNQIEEKQVRDLAGTLGDGEFGLFVTLDAYSKPARVFERNKPKVRLIDGEQLVELLLKHYGNLSPRYRTMLPLKQIYIPDILES